MKPFLIGSTIGWSLASLVLLSTGSANVGTLIVGAIIGAMWIAYGLGRASA